MRYPTRLAPNRPISHPAVAAAHAAATAAAEAAIAFHAASHAVLAAPHAPHLADITIATLTVWRAAVRAADLAADAAEASEHEHGDADAIAEARYARTFFDQHAPAVALAV